MARDSGTKSFCQYSMHNSSKRSTVHFAQYRQNRTSNYIHFAVVKQYQRQKKRVISAVAKPVERGHMWQAIYKGRAANIKDAEMA